MRWTVESKPAKEARKSKWHLTFAVIPHRIKYDDGGKNTWAWLEMVGRRYEYSDGYECGRSGNAIFCSKEDAMLKTMAGE